MSHYRIMAGLAASASVPLVYVACISALVGDLLAGGLLATIGTVLAVMASGYEHRSTLWNQFHSVEYGV